MSELAPDSPSRALVVHRPSVAAPDETLEGIKRQIAEICNSDVMDKPTSLSVTRLFHAMEVLLRHECEVRERQRVDAVAALEHSRLEAELDRLGRRKILDDMRT